MEERWRFLECFSLKILPDHCMEKSPYIESEKRRTLKSFKKVDISVVLEIFMCPQKGTHEITTKKGLEKSSPRKGSVPKMRIYNVKLFYSVKNEELNKDKVLRQVIWNIFKPYLLQNRLSPNRVNPIDTRFFP
jgi:hypothetical protein